jgi:hypothetical protein
MSESEKILLLLAIIAWSAFLAWISHDIGTDDGIEESEAEAVKAGVGEYYLDSDNERQFRWKKP